jgi:hypothetical protein
MTEWLQGRKDAKTVEEKIRFNVWDNVADVLPVLESAKAGKWKWVYNSNCKYIELRVDMRDGGCIITNREGVRINPEDLAYQCK